MSRSGVTAGGGGGIRGGLGAEDMEGHFSPFWRLALVRIYVCVRGRWFG